MNRKGVSPVVATILLIVIVIAIAIIVILWLRGFLPDAITKFGDENVELACDKVILDANLNTETNTLEISNNGNVPIQEISLKLIESNGDYETIRVEEKIRSGRILKIEENQIDGNFPNNGKILVIPVLLGKTESGDTEKYVCDERYGVEVIV